MNKIYLNNFRGFSNTEVPISDINFLVGENSTGKTSLLKLLDLMSANEFWLAGVFRKTDVDFNFFGDVHTKNDNGDKTVVGLSYISNEKEENRYAFELGEDENHNTRINSIKFSFNKNDVQINVDTKGEIKYSVSKNIKSFKSFSAWCRDWNDSEGLKVAGDHQRFTHYGKSPYFMISEIISVLPDEPKSKSKSNIIPFDQIMDDYKWIAPIRVKPQKTYDENMYDYSSDGSHAPYLLKRIMGKRTKKSQEIISALRKFGKEGNLFDDLTVKEFGEDGNSPFAIELLFNDKSRQITNVGYGVSQVLPIVIEVLNSGKGKFAIQQPEVHLHPRAQASFGGFIYDAAMSNSKFVIETHSDFVVDRFRQQLSKKPIPNSSQVLFFERTKNGNKVYSIPILENGLYSGNQPKKFRDFFYNEALKNLSI
ncbi:MAG: AAA family ATPase [Candidatus Microsaccharimonas sp.]